MTINLVPGEIYMAKEVIGSVWNYNSLIPFSQAKAGDFLVYLKEDDKSSSLHEFLNGTQKLRLHETQLKHLWKVEQTNILEEKSFCITGTLDHPREFYKKFIELNGGMFSNTVTKKINYLIIQDKNWRSTKVDKAISLGVKVITFKDFLKLINL